MKFEFGGGTTDTEGKNDSLGLDMVLILDIKAKMLNIKDSLEVSGEDRTFMANFKH